MTCDMCKFVVGRESSFPTVHVMGCHYCNRQHPIRNNSPLGVYLGIQNWDGAYKHVFKLSRENRLLCECGMMFYEVGIDCQSGGGVWVFNEVEVPIEEEVEND